MHMDLFHTKMKKKKSNSKEANEPELSQPNIHSLALVDASCSLGNNVTIRQFSSIMDDCSIGEGSLLGQNVYIPNGVTIGRNCQIQNNVSFYTGVICHDNVYIGPSVVFTNIFYAHLHSNVNQKRGSEKTVIERGVTIGANATIICGVTIGQFAFVSAGSLITTDVKAYALITGNPAKQIGWMSEHGCKMNFLNKTRTAVCPKSGIVYKLEQNLVRKIEQH